MSDKTFQPLNIKTFFNIQRPVWSTLHSFTIGQYDQITGKTRVAESLTMREVQDGDPCGKPTLEIPCEALVNLMNELWNAGIRPVEFQSRSGELDAIRYHLEDMRRMDFKENKND